MFAHGLFAWFILQNFLNVRPSLVRQLSFLIVLGGLNFEFAHWPFALEFIFAPLIYISTLWFFVHHQRAFFLLYKIFAAVIAVMLVTLLWQLDFMFWHPLMTRSDETFLHALIAIAVDLGLTFFVRQLKFYRVSTVLQQRSQLKISILFVLIFYATYLYVTDYHFIKKGLMVPLEFILLLIFLASIALLISNIRLQNSNKERQNLLAIQRTQTLIFDEIAQQNTELRRFRHDYLNTLAALQTSVETANIAEITHIYQTIIQPTHHNLHEIQLTDWDNIKDVALRNLLILKYDYATQKNLRFNIESPFDFYVSNGLAHDIYQILAIWLDNAIESSPEKRHINIQFVSLNEQVILITNEINTLPNTKQWQDAGFTTKSHHDGLGLSTVAQIVTNNPILSTCTEINHHEVTQILSWRSNL
jgi:two-component system sensor histidine kinase AgrC